MNSSKMHVLVFVGRISGRSCMDYLLMNTVPAISNHFLPLKRLP